MRVSVTRKRKKKKRTDSDNDRQSLSDFGLQSLARAYSNDEPDYTDVQLKEPMKQHS